MSGPLKSWLIRGSTIGALAALLVMGWVNREQFAPVESGTLAPGFTLPTLAGQPMSLQDVRGQVVVLNLWATWCLPCEREMPALERLHRAMSASGVRVLAVSLDTEIGTVDLMGNAGGDVARFAAHYGLTMPILLDQKNILRKTYGIVGLPTTYLIDREGRVSEIKLGPAEWDQPPWTDRIRKLLES
jgi:peroxiredoxin